MRSVVQSAPRGVFTRAKVQNDVARILELYRRSGRFEASVDPQTIQLANNRVNLVFVVTEGPKTGVSGITFIGNHAFGDARLRNVIATRQSGILSFIRSGDNYDPDQLSSDEEKLRRYYLDRGYADFQVVSSVAELDRERNAFFIVFTINEGPRYRFGDDQRQFVDLRASTRIRSSDRSMTSKGARLLQRQGRQVARGRSRSISPRTAIRSRRRVRASIAIPRR